MKYVQPTQSKCCIMLEGLKWAKITISKSKKYVFLKVCAIAYLRGGRPFFFWHTFNHLDIIYVWIMPFHIMGKKWACIPVCYLYPKKNKVLNMEVIISYEWKLSYKSSLYIACKLKHLLLILNNGQIMSCIFQRQCFYDT